MSTTIAISNGDIYYAPSGRMLDITSTTKGEQDFCEISLTEYIPDEDYGDELFALVGGTGVMSGANVNHALEAISSQKVKDYITRLQALQQADPYSTPDERFGGIIDLIVKADPTQGTGNILWYVSWMTESGNIVPNKKGFIININQATPPSSAYAQLNTILSSNPVEND